MSKRLLGKDEDGNEVYEGTEIGWKDDSEQSGIAVGRKGNEFKVKVWDSMACEDKIEWVWMDRCWVE